MIPPTAPRLFIAPERFAPPQPVVLSGSEHHYLTRVLRLRPGDPVALLDGRGRLGAARVQKVDGERLELAWEPSTPETTAGATADATADAAGEAHVVLLCGLLKGDKPDFVIQKATELGAHAILQVACQRSVPQLGQERAERRQQRWLRIAQGAAQQCRRADVPRIGGPLTLAAALADCRAAAGPDDLALLLYEGSAPPLHVVLAGAPPSAAAAPPTRRTVHLLIGPEGGLTDEEIAAATAAGFIPTSLGPRILRAETAVVAALSVLQYVLSAYTNP